MLKRSIKHLFALSAGILAITAVPATHANEDYPKHPIEIVVAYPPGGGIDTLARLVGAELGKNLGQSVVVVNKAGAAGSIGTAAVSKAKPDGYTFLLSGANAILSPLVDPRLTFRISDFSPVARLTETPYVLAMSPSLKVSSLGELLEYSKSHPGDLNFASTGMGSVQHLLGELMKQRAQVDWLHVPYQGGSPALQALAAGQIHLMFSNPIPLTPYLENNSVAVAAVATEERLPTLPDVPTMKEQGQDDFVIKTWVGLLAPAGTPEEIRRKISDEVQKVLELPKIRTAIEQQGSIVSPLTVDAFADYLQEDEARWKSIIEQAKFTPSS